VKPLCGEYVDFLSDIIRRTLLSRMGDGVPSLSAGELKMPLEEPGLILPFGAMQADAQDGVRRRLAARATSPGPRQVGDHACNPR
jgi:hypothetical protein